MLKSGMLNNRYAKNQNKWTRQMLTDHNFEIPLIPQTASAVGLLAVGCCAHGRYLSGISTAKFFLLLFTELGDTQYLFSKAYGKIHICK